VLKGTVCQRLMPTKDGTSRVPATEVMVVNGRVQSWILDSKVRSDVQEIIADGDYYGMHSFDQAIIELYAKGTIDLRAALAAASNPHDLSVAMRLRGLDAGRGPAELQGSVEDSATAALHTLVEQLADESPVPPNGKSAKAAKAAQAKAAKAQIEAEDEVSPKPRRRRRTLTKD
jgi:hypothetical protein